MKFVSELKVKWIKMLNNVCRYVLLLGETAWSVCGRAAVRLLLGLNVQYPKSEKKHTKSKVV